MENTSFQRAPLRLKCVASFSRRVASDFKFGDTVTASWTTNEIRGLSDGKDVFILNLKEVNAGKVLLDHTYMFKNLVIKGCRAFFNENTVAFKSYDLAVTPEIVAKAGELLCPPSTPVKSYQDLKEAQGYVSVKVQIISVPDVRQVLLKGTPIPVRDIEASLAGQAITVTLWREMSLALIHQGDWLTVTHLRPTNTAFGFKLSSSTYTELQQTKAEPSTRECTIMGVQAGPDFYLLMMGCGEELKVPTDSWVGTEEEMVRRLPLTVLLDVQGDLIVSPDKLFDETDEQETEELGDLLDLEELLQ